jgi:hypothetical protein
LKIEDLEGTSQGRPGSVRRAFNSVQSYLTSLEKALGFSPDAAPGGGKLRVAPPPLCSFMVTGMGGRYIVEITLHPDLTGPVLHELKSSDTLPVKGSDTVETYPENPATYIEITLPNTSKYFQLRTRYYTSEFNQPQVSDLIDGEAFDCCEPLTNGDVDDPELIFADGDVIMV